MLAAGLVWAGGFTKLGNAIHGHGSFDGMFTDVRSFAIVVVLQVTMAAAIGLLAAQTPVAITALLVAPTAWAAVSSGLLKGASPWFDIFSAYDRLASTRPFGHIAQTLTAVGVWVVLPSVLGLVRSLRREVK